MNEYEQFFVQATYNLSLFWGALLFIDALIANFKPKSNTEAHKSVKWLMIVGSAPILGYLLGQLFFPTTAPARVAIWLFAALMAVAQLIRTVEPRWRIWHRVLWTMAATALLVVYDHLNTHSPLLATAVLATSITAVGLLLRRQLRPQRETVTQP